MHIPSGNYLQPGHLILDKHTQLTAIEPENPLLVGKASVLVTGSQSPDAYNFSVLTDWLKRPLDSDTPLIRKNTLLKRIGLIAELLTSRTLPLTLPLTLPVDDSVAINPFQLVPLYTDLEKQQVIPILGNIDEVYSQKVLALLIGVVARTIVNPNKIITPRGERIVLDGRAIRVLNSEDHGGFVTLYQQQDPYPDIILYPPQSGIW